jgi:3D (Asp-Asp-Asp) domain-containing protein
MLIRMYPTFLSILATTLLAVACDQRTLSPSVDRALPPAVVVRLHGAPGSSLAPIPISVFPFSHDGDTAVAGERRLHAYDCAPAISQRGPEIHYELMVHRPGTLYVRVQGGTGVDVDVHLLTDPSLGCLARGDRELDAGLAPGTYRLVVDTHGAAGPYRLDVALDPPEPLILGPVWNTYYYLANEADHDTPADTPLLSGDCDILADVPLAFHDDLCIEGSGILRDGRVVNYASSCTRECFAALTCGRHRKYKICYSVLAPDRYPWGMGVQGRALEPDVSIAVDRHQIPIGTILYLPELDGVIPPGRSEPHDGCVRADDIGGAIKGNHIDFFAGTRQRWRAWERIFPTRSWFTVILFHPRCYNTPGSSAGGL